MRVVFNPFLSTKYSNNTLNLLKEMKIQAKLSGAEAIELKHIILALYTQLSGQGSILLKDLLRTQGVNSLHSLKEKLLLGESLILGGTPQKRKVFDDPRQKQVEATQNSKDNPITNSNAVDYILEVAEDIARNKASANGQLSYEVQTVDILAALLFFISNLPSDNLETEQVRELLYGISNEGIIAHNKAQISRKLLSNF